MTVRAKTAHDLHPAKPYRFAGWTLDADSRRLTGPQGSHVLEPLMAKVLVHLLECRERVVSQQELLRACWGSAGAEPSVLARVVMKLRRVVEGSPGGEPVILTVRGVGYRINPAVTPTQDTALPMTPVPLAPLGADEDRWAILPIGNDTGDPGLDWVRIGLTALLERSLRYSGGGSLVPMDKVLLALQSCAPNAGVAQTVWHVNDQLGTRSVVTGRLAGRQGHHTLDFELRTVGRAPRSATFTGVNPVGLVQEMAEKLISWRSAAAQVERQVLEIDDGYLNEVFARALHAMHENRLAQAARLLALLIDAGIDAPEVLLEVARIAVLQARPGARRLVLEVERLAQGRGDRALQAHALALRATHQLQRLDVLQATDTMLKAVELAQECGQDELAIEGSMWCSFHLATQFDDRAHPLIVRTVQRAQKLGNRLALRDVYAGAGMMAGIRQDWASSERYYREAAEIGRTLTSFSSSRAMSGMCFAQHNLGRLNEAEENVQRALTQAFESRVEVDLTLSSLAAYELWRDRREPGKMIALYRKHLDLQRLAAPHTVAYACELYCKAALLRQAGEHDLALRAVERALPMAGTQMILRGRCLQSRIAALVDACRWSELAALLDALGDLKAAAYDPRLGIYLLWARCQALCFSAGQREEAADTLRAALRHEYPSIAQGIVTLDTAWLFLDLGDLRKTRALVEDIPAWLAESPMGRLVSARMHYLAGADGEAVRIQSEYLSRHASVATPYQRLLLQRYGDGSRAAHTRDELMSRKSLWLDWRVPAHLVAPLLDEQ